MKILAFEWSKKSEILSEKWNAYLSDKNQKLVDIILGEFKTLTKIEQINRILDVSFRYDAFVNALHYWEAKWLNKQKEEELVLNKGKKSRVNTFERMSYLTPLFISTFHSLPGFCSYMSKSSDEWIQKPIYELFDLMIVDEAGQVSPEIAVPSFSLAKKALVVGDVHQIEPVWTIAYSKIDEGNLQKSKLLSKSNFYDWQNKGVLCSSGSLMRLAQLASSYQVNDSLKGALLTEHRRCVDELVAFSNEYIYDGLLEPKVGSFDGITLTKMNDKGESFILKKGYMATFASTEDGTGKSKNYIASEEDLIINELPAYLLNDVSFIRVIPWNWVNKKGRTGPDAELNNTWNYQWNNTGISSLELEYAPMSWGFGGANDDTDIQLYKSKYKATHVMAFNEADNCNDQSGQYNNLCDTDVAVSTYKNLMKTGLRLVSPSCRENAPFGWLKEFHDKASAQDIRIDVIAVHWYDWGSNPANSPNANPNVVFNRFKTYLQNVYNLYGLPIWITEFNANPNRSTATNYGFMQLALPYLETLDYVERYAWYQPNSGVADYYDGTGTILTNVGLFYKNQVSTPAITESTVSAQSNLDFYYTLDVNDIDYNQSILYPNPTNNIITLKDASGINSYNIYNVQGQLIQSIKNRNVTELEIDLSKEKKGIYFITITDN